MMIEGLDFDLNEGQFLARFATLKRGRFEYGHSGILGVKFCDGEEQDRHRPGSTRIASKGNLFIAFAREWLAMISWPTSMDTWAGIPWHVYQDQVGAREDVSPISASEELQWPRY